MLQLVMFGVSPSSSTHFIVPYLPTLKRFFLTDLPPPQKRESSRAGQTVLPVVQIQFVPTERNCFNQFSGQIIINSDDYCSELLSN